MTAKRTLTVAAAITAFAAAFAQAAPISWTVQTISNTETDISNAGTKVIAASGSDGGATANVVDGTVVATVNGVEFTDDFTLDSPTHFDTLNTRANASGAYFDMLKFADRHSSGTATWSFSGLTIGNTYQFQVWYSDDTTTANNIGLVLGSQTYLDAGSAVTPVINDAGTALLLAEIGPDSPASSPGQFATGSFVADQTTQTIIGRGYTNLLTTPATTGNITINAYQLRDLGVDTSPPSPAPTIATLTPFEASVVVEASTDTTDQTGVEYQFVRRLGLGGSVQFTSAWQDSTTFTDTGLISSTEYSYTVQARDKTPSPGPYSTAVSAEVAVTTLAPDNTDPEPATMSFAIAPQATGYDAITMTAVTATDFSGVEYFFDETSGNPGGDDSGWQDSPVYTDTGLDPNTEYTYTVQARDKSLAQNTNTASSAESATTDAIGTATIAWATPADITNGVEDPENPPARIMTDISLNGTLVEARNGGTGSATVRGVLFDTIANTGNLMANTTNNDNITSRGYGSVVTDASYRSLLQIGQRAADNQNGVEDFTTIEFFGLTPGNTYEIQIWHSDNSGTALDEGLVLGNGSTGAPVQGTDPAVLDEAVEGGAGQYCIGTFVANAPNQAFNVARYNSLLTSPAVNSNHFCNGWQLRDLGVVSGSPFETWVGGAGLGFGFGEDLNSDGVDNGLAFLLGAANPDDSALGLLPTTSGTGGTLVMNFTCLATADRGTAVLNLEYDGDLSGTWLSVPVPGVVGAPNPIVETTATGSVSFVATDGGTNSNGDALIDIEATISDAAESASGKLFGRLKAGE